MYNIYSCVSDHSFVQKLMHMDQKLLNSFWNAFIKEYYGVSEQETEKIEESLVIYNALDLMQRNVRHPGLLSDMIMLILVRPMVKKYFSGYSQMQSRR